MTDVPSIADYDHWGEEAAVIWYEENRYDMTYGDSDPDDPDDEYGYDPTDPDEEAWRGAD